MFDRLTLTLALAFACCDAQSAFAQAKGKKGGAGFPVGPSRVVDDTPVAPAPAFLITLAERTKLRKVFLPYREGEFAPGAAFGGAPGGAAPGGVPEPYVANVYAFRRIQGDEPAKGYLYIGMGQMTKREFPEDDVRKIVQFKKDFAKMVATLSEHAESANLTLNSHGLRLNFNLKTGECQCGSFQIPNGFFDALSDALGDLDKLKAAKPSFQVK